MGFNWRRERREGKIALSSLTFKWTWCMALTATSRHRTIEMCIKCSYYVCILHFLSRSASAEWEWIHCLFVPLSLSTNRKSHIDDDDVLLIIMRIRIVCMRYRRTRIRIPTIFHILACHMKAFRSLPHQFLLTIPHFPDEIFDSLDPILPSQTAVAEIMRRKTRIC